MLLWLLVCCAVMLLLCCWCAACCYAAGMLRCCAAATLLVCCAAMLLVCCAVMLLVWCVLLCYCHAAGVLRCYAAAVLHKQCRIGVIAPGDTGVSSRWICIEGLQPIVQQAPAAECKARAAETYSKTSKQMTRDNETRTSKTKISEGQRQRERDRRHHSLQVLLVKCPGGTRRISFADRLALAKRGGLNTPEPFVRHNCGGTIQQHAVTDPARRLAHMEALLAALKIGPLL